MTADPTPAVLVVGAARDAQDALLRLVAELPWPLPWPVVAVVQNAGPEDLRALVATAPRPMVVVHDRQPLGVDAVHLARDGYHLLLETEGLVLSPDPPEHGIRPAITPLFESAAWTFAAAARGVLLGDVGPDGDAAAAALPGSARSPRAALPSLSPSRGPL